MSAVQATILAAGMGTRLGRPFPKPLTQLHDGRSILQQQLDNLHTVFGDDLRLTVVVGFKHDLVMEAVPDALFAYNENYDQTNTCKSLLKALRSSHEGPVLWMNGDVVFDPEVLRRLQPHLDAGRSAVAVNTSTVADEEVKYTVDDAGFVRELSKTVVGGLGEAVGINVISDADKAAFVRGLTDCADQDYFERGLELAIEREGVQVVPVDISDLFAVEVDFEEDLTRANAVREAGA
ncbi:NTP transferase domain-containing protein [Angustibacter sp. Root456]|uniref:phosphocholine cytidylyltransferase family protein n=1 Tax=Angustibacter sp. Root456 TaxID=1736539 RepID=UPI000ADDAE4D|nr:phosphocholine cytidylyltransferase family protein [Angustibacter sp. Root456]